MQFPGRASQGEQRIAQGHGAEMQVRRRQRQCVQLDHRARRLAQAVAAALEDMPQPVADRGAGILGHGDIDGLQQQVALRCRGCQFHEGVAAVAHDGDVLGRLGCGRGRDFLDGVGRDRRGRRAAASQHRPSRPRIPPAGGVRDGGTRVERGTWRVVLKHRAITFVPRAKSGSNNANQAAPDSRQPPSKEKGPRRGQ
ncbi:hypothetical protein VM57_07030 [Stenotrophomonas maltophilia]|uniref:Uncharacterized protein n=1 Tax=Stenotrophomonas maltophilia TaxID=40324 RepID=A0A0F5ZR36_STEMA|nr:hypothetical protein VM57_07030 [Stenotrophomonas maltophilia]